MAGSQHPEDEHEKDRKATDPDALRRTNESFGGTNPGVLLTSVLGLCVVAISLLGLRSQASSTYPGRHGQTGPAHRASPTLVRAVCGAEGVWPQHQPTTRENRSPRCCPKRKQDERERVGEAVAGRTPRPQVRYRGSRRTALTATWARGRVPGWDRVAYLSGVKRELLGVNRPVSPNRRVSDGTRRFTLARGDVAVT